MAEPKRPSRLLPLLAATAAVLSGLAMLGRRTPRPQAAATQPAASGRGKPTVPANPQAAGLGYETEDISASMVGRILAGFAGTVIVSVALLFLMLHFFRSADNARSRP